ncbi:MAG: response regulator transcription factor [Candidatus Obscuribacterales bacterium]|nr:response regulator transcription factor [Candidatus Obscuribacterales bacterium]
MYKVLVVEDVAALRQHLIKILRETVPDLQLVEACNGLEGLKLYRSEKPDMMIMDILMPEMTGIKAAQQIWSENSRAKILFWSQFHKESYVRELGKIVPDEAIHGYALKTESDEKLMHAINTVLVHDNSYIDPIVRGVQHAINIRHGMLNESESAILADLILGLTDKAIAMRQHISVRGVQNRISSLSDKLVKGLDIHAKETAGLEIFNTRMRIMLEVFRQGFIEPEEIDGLESEMASWLARRLNFEMPGSEKK